MPPQRDKVIANAEKLVAKGKIEAAIKEYDRLLEDYPNDVNTLNRIGDLWVRINRNDEAVKVFTRIADHYSKDGFFLKAIAIYKKINKLDPSKLDIYGKLADLYAKQGLAMEAKSQYQVLADYYLKHGDTANALATYRKISELDPNSINVHVKLADLYSQNNQTAEALKEYDRLGKILLKRGMLDEAVQVFRKALKLDPSNVELAEMLVTTLLEAKDYDNAIQIIESARDGNPNEPGLLALLGRAYAAKGDLSSAQSALEQGLARNPESVAIREALADLHLRNGRVDAAFGVTAPVVDSAVARRDRTAIELLNRLLRVEPAHVPTLTKLVSVYTTLNEETNILASMNSLAEAHIARSDFEAASQVLQNLIRREPENAQHRDKLSFVRQKMSPQAQQAPEPPAARPATATPLPPPAFPDLEIEPPSLDLEDFAIPEPEISLDLDASEPLSLELDAPLDSPPPAPAPRRRVDPVLEPDFADITAPPMADETIEEESEDLDFITEHMTEAEVFAKYGLGEKAIEHLNLVVERAPRHIPAWEKLLQVWVDEGDQERVRATASTYLQLLRESGDDATADSIADDLSRRGYDVGRGESRRAAAAEPAEEMAAESEVEVTAEELQPEPQPEEEFSIEFDAPETEVEFEVDALSFDVEGAEVLEEEPAAERASGELPEAEISEEQPEASLPPDVEFEIPLGEDEPLFRPARVAEPATDDSFVSPAEPAPSGQAAAPAIEELGEIDFYMEQELWDEAESKLQGLEERFPGERQVAQRREYLEQARAAATSKPSSPNILSAADIESELMSAIPLDEEEEAAPAPSAQPQPSLSLEEENLFADEEDFFDLAAELEQELEDDGEEMVALSEEEQSLEEIFREFKKGVEQQLDSEDYDTHYNLGIAYKEMGLIDEAIGEFQLASKDPKRTIECCSMLGLCFLEKGMPQLAIKWYTKGLEVPEITEEEHLGLLYDLGAAYLEVGDTTAAHKAFLEIYGANSNYRDIVSRIKQLEDARK